MLNKSKSPKPGKGKAIIGDNNSSNSGGNQPRNNDRQGTQSNPRITIETAEFATTGAEGTKPTRFTDDKTSHQLLMSAVQSEEQLNGKYHQFVQLGVEFQVNNHHNKHTSLLTTLGTEGGSYGSDNESYKSDGDNDENCFLSTLEPPPLVPRIPPNSNDD
eukprot:jgi/Psemu1/290029/fgenesh1_pg.440_\